MSQATIKILSAIVAGDNTGAGLGMIANKTKQLPNLIKRGLIERLDSGKYAITELGRQKLISLNFKAAQAEPTFVRNWVPLDPKLLLPNAIHQKRMDENRAIPSLVTAGVAYW